MVQQTALRGDLLPSKPRRVRFLEPPLLASRVDSASSHVMWEGYTTAHRTRVRHMRHARLVCSERECKFACYLWEGTTATV